MEFVIHTKIWSQHLKGRYQLGRT